MSRQPLAVFVLAAVALAAQSSAATMVFTHESRGSGTLDGVPFGPADVVITAIGETDERQDYSDGYFIDHASASIAIEGLGTLEFLTPTRTFVNHITELTGFSRAGAHGADLLNGPSDPAFASWDMQSSIGPFTGGGSFLSWTIAEVGTDAGVLVFDQFVATVTFSATIVPSPASVALFGVASLTACRRRR